jgi:hypothetical protein
LKYADLPVDQIGLALAETPEFINQIPGTSKLDF